MPRPSVVGALTSFHETEIARSSYEIDGAPGAGGGGASGTAMRFDIGPRFPRFEMPTAA